MLKLLTRGGAAVALGLVIVIAFGGVVSAVSPHPLRGRMVDIGGRALHLVCAGPEGSGPLVVLEAGAFGLSADWGAVQARLAERSIRSCAYDRAGLGRSDPGPRPRDGLAIATDLEALLARSGEQGPYILVGHSMAGLHTRLFAARNPDKVAGAVLVDASIPEAVDHPRMRRWIGHFATVSRLAGSGASLGLFKPLAPWMGDRIGLPPDAARDKRRAFGSSRHNRWAAEEVDRWMAASAQAKAAGPWPATIPVAVVTAGPVKGREAWKRIQAGPADAASAGRVTHVEAAGHATLLGERFADEIVNAVLFVRDATGG